MKQPAFPRRRITAIPLLTAAGAVIFVFEAMIPTPLPWAKLGLSNIAVLIALCYWGFSEGLIVSWMRVIVGGLFTGSLFSPAFALGICGGLCAVAVMWLLAKYFHRQFSLVGISIAGASAHNTGQLGAAKIIFIQHSGIWNLLPIMLVTAVFTGALVGFTAFFVLKGLSYPSFKMNDNN